MYKGSYMRRNVKNMPLLGTIGWRFLLLGLFVHSFLGISVQVEAMEPTQVIGCEGVLRPDFFKILVDHKVFISQFTPGITRDKSDAICTPVAAANAAQALYYGVTGKAVYAKLLIDFVNEAWDAFTQFPDVDRSAGLPFIYQPAIALAAAQKVELLEYVVPFGYSDPKWLAANPHEVISTRLRIRVLGVATKTGLHSVVSLGFDVKTSEMLILDSNDVSSILRFKLEIRDGFLILKDSSSVGNVRGLRPGMESIDGEYKIVSAFGLNIKEQLPPSANDASYSASPRPKGRLKGGI